MDDALITLDNLSIGYNGQPVLSGLSLAITRTSFTAILGANGSGKSTLLKTLLGLLPPLAGRIDIAGTAGIPLAFGYVPQSMQLDPIYLLTGFEVALMGTYGRVRPGRRVPAAERALTRECLRAAAAEDFAHTRFADLSGGQKQRVLIARALATRPDVLMLDEPTAGVDHAAKHSLLEFIAQLRKDQQLTVLLVTHDFGVVRQHAQHVIWLHDGRAIHGAAEDLLTPDRMAAILETGIG